MKRSKVFNPVAREYGKNRQDAIKRGLQLYFGSSCIRGHDSPRYTDGGGCVECFRNRQFLKKAKFPLTDTATRRSIEDHQARIKEREDFYI